MSEVASLNRARAEKAGDCRLWTALEALEDLVAEIKAGNIKPNQLVIHYYEDLPDGGSKHHYQAAGITYTEHIALLAVAQKRVLEEWLR